MEPIVLPHLTGRPKIAEDQRLRHAVTVRFTHRDFATVESAAAQLGVQPPADCSRSKMTESTP